MVEEVMVEEELSDTCIEDLIQNKLVVFNDDFNAFEWVIDCFIKYLKVSSEEAEKLVWKIHDKGQATVRYGTKQELEPYNTALTDAGLICEIQ